MLRKTLLSALALALIVTLPAAAQLLEGEQEEASLPLLSLEQLLDNYYEAIGGEEAWLAVESLKMTGTMMMGPGMEAPFTVYAQRPDKRRLEFTFQGMTGVQAIDGDEAWQLLPFMGKTEPEAMPQEQVEQMRDQLDIEGALIDWAKKGHTLEMLGPSEAQGTEAYKLKVTLASGREQYYYLDGEAFVPFLMESTVSNQGTETEIETIFSDFKEVDGLMMPHSLEIRAKGQPGGQVITIDSVELGGDLGSVQFSMPAATAAQEVGE